MLFSQYDQAQRLTNANLKGMTSCGAEAYRGDWVLEEGEVADAQGRRKPPVSVVKQSALLAKNGKLIFVSGFLDKIEYLPIFVEKYATDFADGMRCLFFVENIAAPIKVEYAGVDYVLVPLVEGSGMVWNETADLLSLEKSDFKGQSAEDKVVTVYNTFSDDFKPNYPSLDYASAAAQTVQVKKESRGPV